jgi:hypothetical protein
MAAPHNDVYLREQRSGQGRRYAMEGPGSPNRRLRIGRDALPSSRNCVTPSIATLRHIRTSTLSLAADVVALTFGGCDGDDDNSATTTTAFNRASETTTVPEPCEDADGVVFDSVTSFRRRTVIAYLPGSATEPCDDGRILFWNDEGWGYLGEPFGMSLAPSACGEPLPSPRRQGCGRGRRRCQRPPCSSPRSSTSVASTTRAGCARGPG